MAGLCLHHVDVVTSPPASPPSTLPLLPCPYRPRRRARLLPRCAAAPTRPVCPHPLRPPGATLGSFLIALLHFGLELLLFKTLGLATALQPMIVAGARACRLAAPAPAPAPAWNVCSCWRQRRRLRLAASGSGRAGCRAAMQAGLLLTPASPPRLPHTFKQACRACGWGWDGTTTRN